MIYSLAERLSVFYVYSVQSNFPSDLGQLTDLIDRFRLVCPNLDAMLEVTNTVGTVLQSRWPGGAKNGSSRSSKSDDSSHRDEDHDSLENDEQVYTDGDLISK